MPFSKKIVSTVVLVVVTASFILYARERKILASPVPVADAKPVAFGSFSFEERFYEFGTIQSGDTVSHRFHFTNTGKDPLVINDISTGCGCTIADWPRSPIAPQGQGNIDVQFTKRHDPGKHMKTAIIKANTEDPYTVLRISATVLP